MAFHVPYIFLADSVSVTPQNKVDAVGIFDQIGARTFPEQHPRFSIVDFIVASATGDYGSHRVAVAIRHPQHAGGAAPVPQTIQFQPGDSPWGGAVVRIIVQVAGYVFPEPGIYW